MPPWTLPELTWRYVHPSSSLDVKLIECHAQAGIRSVSRDAATQVSDWMTQAQALQADIEKSRKLAGDIVKQAEADEEQAHALEDQQMHLDFLEKERLFNSQLFVALHSIKHAQELFNEAEKLASERDILNALQKVACGLQLGNTAVITDYRSIMEDYSYYSNASIYSCGTSAGSACERITKPRYTNNSWIFGAPWYILILRMEVSQFISRSRGAT